MKFHAVFFNDPILGNICFARSMESQPSNIELVGHFENNLLSQFNYDELEYFETIRSKVHAEKIVGFVASDNCYQKFIEIDDSEWEFLYNLTTINTIEQNPGARKNKIDTMLGKNKSFAFKIIKNYI